MKLRVLDIGGTKIASGVWQTSGLTHQTVQPTPANLPELEQALLHLLANTTGLDGVAIAATGYTDGRVMRAVNQKTIACWQNYPLAKTIEQVYRGPLLIVNDAQAAAWGESVRAQHTESSTTDLFFVTLSTGVGAGLVINGQMQTGARGLSGHIGHIQSNVGALDGRQQCGCGQTDCLETVASGSAIARQASFVAGKPISTTQAFGRAQAGDAHMLKVIQTAASAVAAALSTVCALLDIQRVILGGSVGLNTLMRTCIDNAVQQQLPLFQVQVAHARLGADAGLFGAGHWLARQLLAKRTQA